MEYNKRELTHKSVLLSESHSLKLHTLILLSNKKDVKNVWMNLERFQLSSWQQHVINLFNNNNNMNTANYIFIFCRYIRGHNAITGHGNNYKLEDALRFLSLVTAMYAGERISFRCFIF
jgi:hypothetical protein